MGRNYVVFDDEGRGKSGRGNAGTKRIAEGALRDRAETGFPECSGTFAVRCGAHGERAER